MRYSRNDAVGKAVRYSQNDTVGKIQSVRRRLKYTFCEIQYNLSVNLKQDTVHKKDSETFSWNGH